MDYLKQAEQFLINNDVAFVKPGMIGRNDGIKKEMIFPVPETLDPNVAVVDPPDVRVLVNTVTGEVELIDQM